jgi:hypothetical protein
MTLLEESMNLKNLRIVTLIPLLLMITLACNLFSQVESLANSAQQGQEILETAQSLSTDVSSTGMLETAQAMATQVGESGLAETAQAFATEQGPSLAETAQAVATQQGPGLMETAQAMVTKAAVTFGDAPADIPVVEDENENFFSTAELVSYFTPTPYAEVLTFYKEQMPVNDWIKVDEDWVETESAAILKFTKPDRIATVTISVNPLDNMTVVMITIQPK